MSVGISAIPGGIIYGILTLAGYARWWTAALTITLGLLLGRMMARYVDTKLSRRAMVAPAGEIALVNHTFYLAMAAQSEVELIAQLDARQQAMIIESANPTNLPSADTQISEELYACAHN